MPKDIIRSRYYGREDFSDDVKLTVGWSKEGAHVEVATIMPDDVKLEPTPEGNGWFIQLDRAGINRLIRSLRKARDDAYGKDA